MLNCLHPLRPVVAVSQAEYAAAMHSAVDCWRAGDWKLAVRHCINAGRSPRGSDHIPSVRDMLNCLLGCKVSEHQDTILDLTCDRINKRERIDQHLAVDPDI